MNATTHFCLQWTHHTFHTLQTYHFRLQTKFNWLAVPKNVIEMVDDIISFLLCHDFDLLIVMFILQILNIQFRLKNTLTHLIQRRIVVFFVPQLQHDCFIRIVLAFCFLSLLIDAVLQLLLKEILLL